MLAWLAVALGTLVAVAAEGAPVTNVHDFGFTSIDGEPLPMPGFAGEAVLVVNTASLCGFTYQYAAL
jgi:glutathione peroxidase